MVYLGVFVAPSSEWRGKRVASFPEESPSGAAAASRLPLASGDAKLAVL